MVVSFMVAVPSRWLVVVPPWHGPCRRSCRAFPEQGPHAGDVVLLHGRGEDRRALFIVRTAAAEGVDRRLRLPALEDVDAAGVDQVGGDREIEAAGCPASLLDDAHTAREVRLALLRLNGDVSCNDDHGCAPVLSPSCPARRAV